MKAFWTVLQLLFFAGGLATGLIWNNAIYSTAAFCWAVVCGTRASLLEAEERIAALERRSKALEDQP